jgi:hypothetical protein
VESSISQFFKSLTSELNQIEDRVSGLEHKVDELENLDNNIK